METNYYWSYRSSYVLHSSSTNNNQEASACAEESIHRLDRLLASSQAQDVEVPSIDQSNKGGGSLSKSIQMSSKGKSVDFLKWYPNNPTWKGRIPTQFHASNVAIEDGYAKFAVNQHGDDKLLDGYTPRQVSL